MEVKLFFFVFEMDVACFFVFFLHFLQKLFFFKNLREKKNKSDPIEIHFISVKNPCEMQMLAQTFDKVHFLSAINGFSSFKPKKFFLGKRAFKQNQKFRLFF